MGEPAPAQAVAVTEAAAEEVVAEQAVEEQQVEAEVAKVEVEVAKEPEQVVADAVEEVAAPAKVDAMTIAETPVDEKETVSTDVPVENLNIVVEAPADKQAVCGLTCF